MPFLIRLAMLTGWAWSLRLHAVSVKPWNGVYNPKTKNWGPRGYEAWRLKTVEQVKQVAKIFGMEEKDIPWDSFDMEPEMYAGEKNLADRNPVLYFGKQKNGTAEIEFHRYKWDVNSYMCDVLGSLPTRAAVRLIVLA